MALGFPCFQFSLYASFQCDHCVNPYPTLWILLTITAAALALTDGYTDDKYISSARLLPSTPYLSPPTSVLQSSFSNKVILIRCIKIQIELKKWARLHFSLINNSKTKKKRLYYSVRIYVKYFSLVLVVELANGILMFCCESQYYPVTSELFLFL